MCRITHFVYCDSIQSVPASPPQNVIYQLVNPLQILSPAVIPGGFSFSISFGIRGLASLASNSSFRIEFCDPGGKALYATSEIPIPKEVGQQENIPVAYQGFNVNLDIRNLLIESPGEYIGRVLVDQKPCGEFPVYVMERPKNNASSSAC